MNDDKDYNRLKGGSGELRIVNKVNRWNLRPQRFTENRTSERNKTKIFRVYDLRGLYNDYYDVRITDTRRVLRMIDHTTTSDSAKCAHYDKCK